MGKWQLDWEMDTSLCGVNHDCRQCDDLHMECEWHLECGACDSVSRQNIATL